VRAPTLVIQGEDDEYGTVAQLEAIGARVAGRCRTLLLPECGHAPHRDQPARTLQAMTELIARVTR
jgi:pimeloyl-ACP methyl ester carboxylesterase